MYVKLFESMLDSTIWQESSDTRVVWITILAMADRDGIVQASVPGLARRAGVSLEATEEALRVFQRPDPYSRTPDHDGRRIEPVPGGWRIINYETYRERASREEAKEKSRLRQERYRQRHPEVVTQRNGSVTEGNESNAIAEVEADTEAVKRERTPADLHELQYAARIVEDLELVSTPKLIEVVGSAVVTAAKRNKITKSQGFEWLRKRAMDARDVGTPVNRFWFEDADKWELRNGNNDGIAREVVGTDHF